MPGVVVVPQNLGIAPAIDDLLLLVECGYPKDFHNRVIYLPLRA